MRPPAPRTSFSLRLAAVLCVLALVVVGVAAMAGSGSGKRAPLGRAGAIGRDMALRRPASRQSSLERGRAAAERTAPARARQRRSRSAYARLSGRGALRVARRAFKGVVDAPVWRGPKLHTGERVRRYLGPTTAQITTSNGKTALVKSTFPMTTRAHGRTRVVDLSLRRAGRDLVPAAPLVSARLSLDARRGVTFGPSETGVAPDGGRGRSGTVVHDKVFYPNVATDTDLLVKPVPRGIETFTQLRSAASPESTTLKLSLPRGALLRSAGGRALQIVRGKVPLVEIAPASATDAAGTPVPVSYSIHGDRLTLNARHHAGSYRYPIAVDPVFNVIEDFRNPSNPQQFANNTSFWGWEMYASTSWNHVEYPGTGLDASARSGVSYPLYSHMAWWWPTIGMPSDWTQADLNNIEAHWKDAYIYQAYASTSFTPKTGSSAACELTGIYDRTAAWWDGVGGNSAYWAPPCNAAFSGRQSPAICVAADCSASAGADGNKFMHELYAGQAGTLDGAWSRLNWAVIYMTDRYAPTVTSVSHSRDLSGWLPEGTSVTSTAPASERGLGLRDGRLLDARSGALVPVTTGSSSQVSAASGRNPVSEDCYTQLPAHGQGPPSSTSPGTDQGFHGLDGATQTWYARCPLSDTYSFTYATSSLAEGIDSLGVDAYDIVSHRAASTPPSWTVKVDRTPPSIGLSGTLWDNRQTGDSADQNINGGTYSLHVDAQDGANDGNPADARSGVETIDVYVDGAQQNPVAMHRQQACPGGSCPLTLDWTFDAGAVPPGDHTILVTTTDQLGHLGQAQFTVTKTDPSELPQPPAKDSVVWSTTAGPDDSDDGSSSDPGPMDGGLKPDGTTVTSAASAPRASPSWYVTSGKQKTGYNHGCAAGHKRRRGPIILFIGGPAQKNGLEGTRIFASAGSTYRPLKTTRFVAEAFARGYYHCLPHSSKGNNKVAIFIVMSENNSTGSSVNSDSGNALGRSSKLGEAYLRAKGIYANTTIQGGSDMEPGFGPPQRARDWVHGYYTAWKDVVWNTGSADGCPPYGNCNHGWRPNDVYYVSSGPPNAIPIPEIYYKANAKQWARVSLWGPQHNQSKITFVGPLSEHQADSSTLTAAAAWSALFSEINKRSQTKQRSMPYSAYLTGGPGSGAW